jgi:hypothetical protein
MGKNNSKTVQATTEALYELSLASINNSDGIIYIYEKYSLTQLVGQEKAHELRTLMQSKEIIVQQISNHPQIEDTLLPGEALDPDFKKAVMHYHYVPKEIFSIEHEMLIFGDTVAWYSLNEEGVITSIVDPVFSNNQKQLFRTLLQHQGLPRIMDKTYIPNHSFYNSIDVDVNGMRVIVWPDADAKNSYGDIDQVGLAAYVETIIAGDMDYYQDASYVIVFIWSYDGEKMADVWKFTDNTVDDRSGPLSDVRVYREGVKTTELGLGSGNTLLVLGHEEKLRRQSRTLQAYLAGNPPELPLEVLNRQNFF